MSAEALDILNSDQYSRKTVSRMRKTAKRWDRKIKEVLLDNVSVIRSTKLQYKKAIRETTNSLLQEMPLWQLREFGASGARTSLLEKAGFLTAYDIRNSSVKQIQQVKGVGFQSAQKIKKAADVAFETVSADTIPDLDIHSKETIELMRLLCIIFLYENHVAKLEESMWAHGMDLKQAAKKAAPLSSWWKRIITSKEKQIRLIEHVDAMAEAISEIKSLNVIQFYMRRKKSFLAAPENELRNYVLERKEHFVSLLSWIGNKPANPQAGEQVGPHSYAVVERSVASGSQILYRMFDDKDVLLYVGITNSLERRLKQHSEEKPWFTRIDRVEIEKFESRKEVENAERHAILNEKPLHNIIFNQHS